jgi:hypothetical protein
MPFLLCLAATLALAQGNSDRAYAAGRSALARGDFAVAERSFAEAVRGNPSAANWRWLGEARVGLRDYDGASAAFRSAILKYRMLGDALTANALANQTNQYRQETFFYRWNQPALTPRKLARLEPKSGLLLGCYVDETGIDRDGRFVIPARLGTGLAVYFRYHKLIRSEDANRNREIFPTRFALAARRSGAALHIALEPSMPLAEVTESVVNAFARGVRDSGVPVFVRFASEFNDPANQWSRDPVLYVQKFRLMADALHRIAPNAATVWMPMASRLEVIDRYYPGAAYVDWAGLSLYSTPFSNGDAAQSNARVSPLDAIAGFYAKYASVHPIQISEYASSHETGLKPGVDFSAFAAQKMRMLYWGAMLRFPRLKNINWLDVDMLRSRFVSSSNAERRNNYALFSNPVKLEVFKTLLFEPYFLRDLAASSSFAPSPLTTLPANTRNLEIAAWVKTFDPNIARVRFRVAGREFASSESLPYRVTLPPLPAGSQTLTLTAFDARGQVLMTRSQRLRVR